jgi:hypothetical protein
MRFKFSNANPFLAWTQYAWSMNEMLFASAQVIGLRSGRLLAAGALPNARDRREFTLMGQEKIEAATESIQAMALQTISANLRMAEAGARQWMRGAQMMATFGNPLLAPTANMQSALLRNLGSNAAALAAQFAGSAATVAHHGLRPIHSRATRNAKRLSKG